MARHTLLQIEVIQEENKNGFGVKFSLPDFIDPRSKEIEELKDDVEKIVHKLGGLFGANTFEKVIEKEEIVPNEDAELKEMLNTAKMFGELAGMMKKVAPKSATEEELKQLDEMEQFAEIAKMVEKFIK